MKKLLNKKGFTIIEVMVTLAVLGIVIVPLMTMFITSQKINNEGSKEYQSIQLAQKYMEEIKGMEAVNDLNILYNVPSDYSYTENADGSYDIESLPAKEFPFIVDIGVKPLTENSKVNISNVTSSETITITDTEVKKNNIPISDINNNNLDITLETDKIKIGEAAPFTLNPATLKIILKSDVTLNFINSEIVGKFYVENHDDDSGNTFNCSVNVYGGMPPNIYILDEVTTKEILYEITIKVDGKQILQSTKIFK